jgi:hypothetical protein
MLPVTPISDFDSKIIRFYMSYFLLWLVKGSLSCKVKMNIFCFYKSVHNFHVVATCKFLFTIKNILWLFTRYKNPHNIMTILYSNSLFFLFLFPRMAGNSFFKLIREWIKSLFDISFVWRVKKPMAIPAIFFRYKTPEYDLCTRNGKQPIKTP